MTRLPLVLAFLSGALCGGLVHFASKDQPVAPAPVPRTSGGLADGLAAWPGAVLDAVRIPPPAHLPTLRNVFTFLEPPPLPRVVDSPAMAPPQLPTARVAAHFTIEPPPFPYHFIGTFGPRQNELAVFVRDGEVINARVGDAIAERFRLRRIGIESVDLAWGGPEELRVPLRSAGEK